MPRYTSYPTVPFWNDEIDRAGWENACRTQFDKENHTNGISLYIHLPFCESLCTYCGCNKKITKNHGVENEYLVAIEKEWKLYRKLMNQTPIVREVHLGGGTPTFFSPPNLQRLLNIILKSSIIHPSHSFSIEGHPNNTTIDHLKVLFRMGFRRISYGVQDNDPQVQKIINRIQPFENVKEATESARKVGFTSVNFDLIYGLPLQTAESIETTFREIITLKPDRIAFYSYAHVPWTSKAQRQFDESHLPNAEEKLKLYVKGKELLVSNGYVNIGMDHFALPDDELCQALANGTLHRNFMGYTTQHTGMLLGLGVSAISDIGIAFGQNRKTLHEYYQSIHSEVLPVKKGYYLTREDQEFRKYILDIACKGHTELHPEHLPTLREFTFPALDELVGDGLVEYTENYVKLTNAGHYFIRNICSAFDLKLRRSPSVLQPKIFSKAV